MLHRRLQRVRPIERAATEAADQWQALEPVLSFYEALRRAFAPRRVRPARVPSPADLEVVQLEALKGKAFADFFQTLAVEGDFERATVAMTRNLIDQSIRSRARIVLQVFARYQELRPIAEVGLALCAFYEPMPEPAWTLFTRNDLGLVLRWAATEYFELGFCRDPETAAASLARVLRGEIPLEADADTWLEIAYQSFAAGRLDLADQSLTRATAVMPTAANPGRAKQLELRLSTLREWLARAARAQQRVELPAGEIPFALLGFKHPDWRSISQDLDDPTETLAALGQLLRHAGVTFSGDADLVSVAEQLRKSVPSDRRIDGTVATVRLYEVDRDASQYAAVPDGTWTLVSEWFTAPLGGWRYDIPLHPNLRPIFIGFHITPAELSAPGAVDYLRAHGPIGCRDRESAYLLHSARVPAFFSGALEMTVDTVVPRSAPKAAATTLFVDTAPDGPGERRSRKSPAVQRRSLSENVTAAADALRRYQHRSARIVTSALRCYLAARAVGCPAEYRHDDPHDHRVTDFLDLSDADFAAMQRGIAEKLAAVLGAVLAGGSPDEVHETWRAACAADVKRVEAELAAFADHPELDFDLDAVCNTIRSRAITVERTQPGPAGPEINVEFSVDQNYTHQLDIVLDSVVEHASRPVRAFICCRGLAEADFDRLTRVFPTVSFVFLRTDDIRYGEIAGKIKWATVVTMDRTILPALLDDVDRIIHFDLDALCLDDLAELFHVDMEGMAIAAADEPQPNFGGGFNSFRNNATRLRKEGRPDLARELLLRTHAQHSFDFNIFNAGIMVLDLAKMRADDFCGRYLAYVQRFGINGQSVLNYYVGGARKKVSPDWNRLVRLEVPDAPKVAHWAGPFKPWGGHQYVAERELWRAQEERFAARTKKLAAVAVS